MSFVDSLSSGVWVAAGAGLGCALVRVLKQELGKEGERTSSGLFFELLRYTVVEMEYAEGM